MNRLIRIFVLSCLFSSSLQAVPAYLKNFPKESYHRLTSQNQIVGKSSLLFKETPEGLKWVENSVMKLTLFKAPQTIETEVTVITNDRIEIKEFSFTMNTGASQILISGKRAGPVMRLNVKQAGQTQVKELTIEEPLLLSPTIRPYLLMKGLKKQAAVYETRLLEPSALTIVPLSLSVKPKGEIFTLNVSYLSQTLTSDIDKRGELLYENSSLAGLPIEAKPVKASEFKSIVMEATKKDLVDLAKVPFPEFAKAREAKKFSVKISGIEPKDFVLTRHRQKLKDNILSIEKEALPTQSLPVQALAGQKGFEKYLEGDTSIPTFDPVIQKQAREIVGAENDLWKRAFLIQKWVYKELEKVPTISIPNALEVLKTKKGDCNEHAALYTALARAAGIPTRTVVGLVYSDRFYGERGFYYHAWVEVFSGKEWTAIDPTWDQLPADVTHISFVEGSLDQQVQVIGLMGRIRLAPVEPVI